MLDFSKPLHGQVIDYSELKHLPNRFKFLDSIETKKISKIINNGNPLLFQPTALSEQNLPELDNSEENNPDNKYKKWYYKLILFGIFPDGRSATLVITGIYPYVYVEIPCKYKSTVCKRYKFRSKIEDIMREHKEFANQKKGIEYISIEIVEKKKFMGFCDGKSYFLKIIFAKAGTSYSPRNRAIRLFNKNYWKTCTDDKSGYYKIPIRDSRLTVSSWIEVKNYTVLKKNKYFKDNKIYVVNVNDISECSEKMIQSNQALARDKTMIMGWDIECVSKTGALPVPENPDDKLFMICLDFQWHYSKDQLLRINLVDHPVSSHSEFISVVCHTEKNILKAFAYMFNIMTPEYVVGFNDTGFDWPWIVGKAWIHSKKNYEEQTMDKSVLEYMAKKMDRLIIYRHYYKQITFNKWRKIALKDNDFPYYTGDKLKTTYNAYISSVIGNYRKEKIKIDSDTYHYGYFLQYNGYIAFDVRTIFRQLYPTAEKTTLNYFLTTNNLKLKEDMDIQEMFKIYWEMDGFICKYKSIIDKHNFTMNESKNSKIISQFTALKDKMKEVSYYCIIDSQRCPELVKKRNIISDKQEIAKLSYTSKYDAFYRAGGVKIRNMVFPILQDRGYITSNLSQKKCDIDKYPGAKVLNPQTGLYVPKLTIEERVEKHAEFIKEFGQDFKESYSLRKIPYTKLMRIENLSIKKEYLKKALLEIHLSGVSLSMEDAKKVNALAKQMYEDDTH